MGSGGVVKFEDWRGWDGLGFGGLSRCKHLLFMALWSCLAFGGFVWLFCVFSAPARAAGSGLFATFCGGLTCAFGAGGSAILRRVGVSITATTRQATGILVGGRPRGVKPAARGWGLAPSLCGTGSGGVGLVLLSRAWAFDRFGDRRTHTRGAVDVTVPWARLLRPAAWFAIRDRRLVDRTDCDPWA